MSTRILLIAAFTIITTSCNSNKSTTDTAANTIKTTMNQEEMITNGYVFGTIEKSNKEGDCPITIRMGEGKEVYYFDPVNLEENYKKDGQEVYFKFRGLRMMNRCERANPVQIEEMQVK